MSEERAVFITCPDAGMTMVTFSANSATLLSKVGARSPLPVVLVAEVAASRAVVAAVQKKMNGARAHGQWFDGLVTEEQARELVEEGERSAKAPSGGEVTSFKYAVRLDVEAVLEEADEDDIDALDAAREAYEHADALIRDFEARAVAESHIDLATRLREELVAAGELRASRGD